METPDPRNIAGTPLEAGMVEVEIKPTSESEFEFRISDPDMTYFTGEDTVELELIPIEEEQFSAYIGASGKQYGMPVKEKIADFGHRMAQVGKSRLSDVSETIRSSAHRGTERLRSSVSSARELGSRTLDTVEEQIQTRPLVSLGIGFVIGLIVGGLLSRMRRRWA